MLEHFLDLTTLFDKILNSVHAYIKNLPRFVSFTVVENMPVVMLPGKKKNYVHTRLAKFVWWRSRKIFAVTYVVVKPSVTIWPMIMSIYSKSGLHINKTKKKPIYTNGFVLNN